MVKGSRRVCRMRHKVFKVPMTFPPAGEVNHLTNHLVDLCVAVWERGGCAEEECSRATEVRSILSLYVLHETASLFIFYLPVNLISSRYLLFSFLRLCGGE